MYLMRPDPQNDQAAIDFDEEPVSFSILIIISFQITGGWDNCA